MNSRGLQSCRYSSGAPRCSPFTGLHVAAPALGLAAGCQCGGPNLSGERFVRSTDADCIAGHSCLGGECVASDGGSGGGTAGGAGGGTAGGSAGGTAGGTAGGAAGGGTSGNGDCAVNNGGCDAHAQCTNLPGSYTCACTNGWLGDGGVCADLDECATKQRRVQRQRGLRQHPGLPHLHLQPGLLGRRRHLQRGAGGRHLQHGGDAVLRRRADRVHHRRPLQVSATSIGASNSYGTGLFSTTCRNNGNLGQTPQGAPGNDVVYDWTADSSRDDTVTADTFPGFDVVLWVTRAPAGAGDGGACIAGQDSNGTNPSLETFTFRADAGQHYFIVVDGFNTGDQGDFALMIQ